MVHQESDTAEMRNLATIARMAAVGMTHRAKKSHVGSCLSCADILSVMFSRSTVSERLGEDEDRIVVGKGWVAAIFYWFLAQKRIVPAADLDRFCAEGETEYIGLLEPSVRGVWMAGGSVGYGLPFGAGMALAKKLTGRKGEVLVLEGDGAMQSGTTWEAAQAAANMGLDNLKMFVDANGLQAMGEVKGISDNRNLAAKFRAFGWEAEDIDGHDHAQLAEAMQMRCKGRPLALICRTVKGKGVSFMENDFTWHYRAPNASEEFSAVRELKELL